MLDLLAAAAHETGEHVYPTAFGIAPHGWTAIAMLLVFAIMLWAGVPRIIAGILDSRIEGIRKQLDEAASLRAEAEALRNEYAAKAAAIDKDIEDLRVRAERDAEAIVAKAQEDATALIERHKALAAEKIAAAERNAVTDLRNRAAAAAAAAAHQLIAEKHGEDADRKLADEIIAGI
ncbi:F0F1 ATP synthase subunit B family protein [Tsuneonella sp. SYSU-LHT278]|uniref:F0F1 ATP synthase subunit B family protein n=1 Tax=Tsuneonella sediminis TaxID=3416089 RepID=UPI003F79C6F9